MGPTPDAYVVLSSNPDLKKALRLIALGGEAHFILVANVLLRTTREGRSVDVTTIDWHELYLRFGGGKYGTPR